MITAMPPLMARLPAGDEEQQGTTGEEREPRHDDAEVAPGDRQLAVHHARCLRSRAGRMVTSSTSRSLSTRTVTTELAEADADGLQRLQRSLRITQRLDHQPSDGASDLAPNPVDAGRQDDPRTVRSRTHRPPRTRIRCCSRIARHATGSSASSAARVVRRARRAVEPVVLERDRDLLEALVALGGGGIAIGDLVGGGQVDIVAEDRQQRPLLLTTLTSTLRTMPMAMMNVDAVSRAPRRRRRTTRGPLTTPLT